MMKTSKTSKKPFENTKCNSGYNQGDAATVKNCNLNLIKNFL